jgi:hypothetical protein
MDFQKLNFQSNGVIGKKKSMSRVMMVPVAQPGMKMDDHIFLSLSPSTSFEIWPQVINPPQSTTLTTPHQTCNSWISQNQN